MAVDCGGWDRARLSLPFRVPALGVPSPRRWSLGNAANSRHSRPLGSIGISQASMPVFQVLCDLQNLIRMYIRQPGENCVNKIGLVQIVPGAGPEKRGNPGVPEVCSQFPDSPLKDAFGITGIRTKAEIDPMSLERSLLFRQKSSDFGSSTVPAEESAFFVSPVFFALSSFSTAAAGKRSIRSFFSISSAMSGLLSRKSLAFSLP